MDFSNVKKVFLPSRLPYGYQEVEYIESKKPTQYIDTGVSLRDYDQNLDITIDFQETYIGNIAVGLVSSGSYSGLYWFTFPEVASQSFYIQMAAGTWATISPKPSGRCLIKSNSKTGVVSVDDFSCTTTTQSFIDYANEHSITNNGNLYLFGANNIVNDSVSIGASRVYYALFKNATTGEKIKEFIPCYRTSDNKIGMFDLVTKSFYPSNGSSDFTIKGNDVDTGEEVIKISIPSGEVTHNLPTEYQEVEYIESDGTQWVDSGTASQVGHKHTFEGTISITSNNGDRETVWGNDYTDLQQNTLLQYAELGEKATWTYYHSLIDDSNLLKKNGVTVSSGSYSYGGNATIAIFSSYFYYPMRYSHIKLFELKIYYDNETTPIRHFIPCYRKSDGIIGIYDIINGAFHTKQSGNDFTKGDDIIGEIVLWEKPEQ